MSAERSKAPIVAPGRPGGGVPRTLIEGGYLVPMTGAEEVVSDGLVAVEGDRIVYAGSAEGFDRAAFAAQRVIPARGRAVLPGLVNTHIHLVGAYLKGITEDVPGRAAGLFDRALPILRQCRSREDVYFGGMVHAMEAVMGGTTTVVNTWHNDRFLAEVARDLGLRASVSEFLVEIGMRGLSAENLERAWRRDRLAKSLEAAEALYETWHGAADGRITVRVSPGGPGYLSLEGMAESRALADRLGVGVNVHIAELPGETEFAMKLYGKRPIELGVESGVLRPDAIAIHCVFMDEGDVARLAESGAHMSHTSHHVTKRGYFPPMPEIYAARIPVTLGTDWCSNDLWDYMRAAILVPRAMTGDVGMLRAHDALEMATIAGARALGMADEIGSLAPGKKADVILVDVSRPWCQPIRLASFVSNLVYNVSASDVTDVFVGGRDVVRDREVVTVDRIAVQAEAQARAERIWAAAERDF